MPGFLTLCVLVCFSKEVCASTIHARQVVVRRAVQQAKRAVATAANRNSAEYTQQDATTWLLQHRPKYDNSTHDFVAAHALGAVRTRDAFSWAQEVPLQLFQEYVLPYTHFDEKAEPWRAYFFEKLEPSVQNASSLRDAATAIQQGIWTAFGDPSIHFKANSTPAVLSPMSELLVKRYGSCTAMSIFLADGLRSCGVPARVVGTPVWNRPEKGNHNWVEAWFDGRWNFIDANPGERWNEAWFKDEASKAIPNSINGIYTPTWNQTEVTGTYTVTWRDPFLKLPAIDLTQEYKTA